MAIIFNSTGEHRFAYPVRVVNPEYIGTTAPEGEGATAEDIVEGKVAFVNGEQVVGTSSGGGGGGGLEYETGIYTATETAHEIRIPFAKAHLTPPALVYVCKTDAETTLTDENTQVSHFYINGKRLFGYGYKRSSSSVYYGIALAVYRLTSSTTKRETADLMYDDTDSANDNVTKSRFWVDESGFKLTTSTPGTMLEEGKSYQWIAIWPEA